MSRQDNLSRENQALRERLSRLNDAAGLTCEEAERLRELAEGRKLFDHHNPPLRSRRGGPDLLGHIRSIGLLSSACPCRWTPPYPSWPRWSSTGASASANVSKPRRNGEKSSPWSRSARDAKSVPQLGEGAGIRCPPSVCPCMRPFLCLGDVRPFTGPWVRPFLLRGSVPPATGLLARTADGQLQPVGQHPAVLGADRPRGVAVRGDR